MTSMRYGGYDKVLIFDLLALLVFGLVVISSASVVESYHNHQNNYYYVTHQLMCILPGLGLAYLAARFDYRKLRNYAPFFLMATLVLLLLVFIPGLSQETKGASRWVDLGIRFQPSELAKLTFMIYLAAWLDQKRSRLNDFHEGFLPFVVLLALVAIPLIKQPDIGTLIAISMPAVVMYFMAGADFKNLGMIAAGGVGGILLLAKLEPYRAARLTVFMDPNPTQEELHGIAYQINQALLALGSGGLFGLGLGHSRQKFNYLPEPMGDSVFAIIGEELGLVGLVLLVSLYLVLALRGYGIAASARDGFGRLLAVGLTSWIVFQAIVNIGAITSLMPLTGIPLPFISYGGSSVISLLLGMGLLLSVSRFGGSSISR